MARFRARPRAALLPWLMITAFVGLAAALFVAGPALAKIKSSGSTTTSTALATTTTAADSSTTSSTTASSTSTTTPVSSPSPTPIFLAEGFDSGPLGPLTSNILVLSNGTGATAEWQGTVARTGSGAYRMTGGDLAADDK